MGHRSRSKEARHRERFTRGGQIPSSKAAAKREFSQREKQNWSNTRVKQRFDQSRSTWKKSLGTWELDLPKKKNENNLYKTLFLPIIYSKKQKKNNKLGGAIHASQNFCTVHLWGVYSPTLISYSSIYLFIFLFFFFIFGVVGRGSWTIRNFKFHLTF